MSRYKTGSDIGSSNGQTLNCSTRFEQRYFTVNATELKLSKV